MLALSFHAAVIASSVPSLLDGAPVHGLLQDVHDLLHVGAVLNLKQNDLVRRAGHGGRGRR